MLFSVALVYEHKTAFSVGKHISLLPKLQDEQLFINRNNQNCAQNLYVACRWPPGVCVFVEGQNLEQHLLSQMLARTVQFYSEVLFIIVFHSHTVS